MKNTKRILILIILLTLNFSIKTFGKELSGKTALSKSETLLWSISDFNPKKHYISYCWLDTPRTKYPCKIDYKNWYGLDFPNELPKTEFIYLKIKIEGKIIDLNTSTMFNPLYTLYRLSDDQFKLKKFKGYYILYSFFADGAATYTVHWRIENGKSTRLKISRDETDFKWQLE